jgi:hypothetical protein
LQRLTLPRWLPRLRQKEQKHNRLDNKRGKVFYFPPFIL